MDGNGANGRHGSDGAVGRQDKKEQKQLDGSVCLTAQSQWQLDGNVCSMVQPQRQGEAVTARRQVCSRQRVLDGKTATAGRSSDSLTVTCARRQNRNGRTKQRQLEGTS